MIDQATRIRRNPDVVFRSLEEDQGGVLLHLESGEYHGLNDLGSLIWRLIENESSFADVVVGGSGALAVFCHPERSEGISCPWLEQIPKR